MEETCSLVKPAWLLNNRLLSLDQIRSNIRKPVLPHLIRSSQMHFYFLMASVSLNHLAVSRHCPTPSPKQNIDFLEGPSEAMKKSKYVVSCRVLSYNHFFLHIVKTPFRRILLPTSFSWGCFCLLVHLFFCLIWNLSYLHLFSRNGTVFFFFLFKILTFMVLSTVSYGNSISQNCTIILCWGQRIALNTQCQQSTSCLLAVFTCCVKCQS